MISVNEKISLGPVSSAFIGAVLDNGWLDDETENRQQGFGKGYDGRVTAREALTALLDREGSEAEFGLVGVYEEGEPAGFVAVNLLMDNRKTADLYVFVAPTKRRRGIGSAVRIRIMEYAL